ncbi:hypothetical protein ACFW1M_06335 [Streptomyces inhibens]|uniref:hypothetical protein n=1 Tax=Streptomyces inhibens TaxID=2293571 RepID=UPI00368F5B76
MRRRTFLMGIAGGRWGWNTRPVEGYVGQPVVCPDPDLGLSPIAPLLLISHAFKVGTGTASATEVERLCQAVAEHREMVPGWQSVKGKTPRLDPEPPGPPHPEQTAWLTGREAAFPAWQQDAGGPPDQWDFSAASLDAREARVREPDAKPGAPGSVHSGWTRTPFVALLGKRGSTALISGAALIPMGCLNVLLSGGPDERLRSSLDGRDD